MKLLVVLTHIINVVSGLGYGLALTSLPVEIVRKYAEITNFDAHNPTILSIMEVGVCVGAALGCILTPFFTKKIGMVKSLQIMFALLTLSLISCVFPVHWVYIAILRMICGFFTFAISSITPLLVSEILDPKQRGIALIIYSILLTSGITVGYFVHLLISSNYNYWQFTFLLSGICSSLGFISSIMVKKFYNPVKSSSE